LAANRRPKVIAFAECEQNSIRTKNGAIANGAPLGIKNEINVVGYLINPIEFTVINTAKLNVNVIATCVVGVNT
jgi:hypothetical protein